jgi:hypothetical protein
VVTSGVVFPGVDPGGAVGRATAARAGCVDCSWSVVASCAGSVPGVEGGGLCAGAVSGCVVAGEVSYRVYVREGEGGWVLVGTVCLGPGGAPVGVADVGAAVRRVVVSYLPDGRPSFQPAGGGLVNLPVLFAAGEPAVVVTEPFVVLGFEVVVRARARWEWGFEPGVVAGFGVAGGGWPDDSVSYTYRGPGVRWVGVSTWWRCEFTVDGAGPFVVPGGEIVKSAGPVRVPVREARSQLVADS